MRAFLPLLTIVLLLANACSTTTAIPSVDVQLAVEKTVTALVAELTDALLEATATPVPTQIAIEIPTEIILSHETPETVCAPPERDFEIGLVTEVVDGDTIEVSIDGRNYAVRYIGIDTPERGDPGGAEAKAKNSELVSGEVVTLGRDVSQTDRFDRLLRYVYLSDNTFVNAELVRSGHARAVAYQPDVKCQDLLEQIQREAKLSGLGLWAQPTATIMPPAGVIAIQVGVDPACSQFNAPGDDNNNKNEEYVCFTNQGTQPVILTAWTVKDSYGWSFTFPEFSLDVGASVKVRTGCGTNTQGDLYWCRSETAIWNNGGDCVYLINGVGEKVSEYCY
ncbi:MAG: hypothetical protein A2Z45_02900 [Chloroflexi bacterium RBG_19FT_COMBO_55_16]|nr:MAG: hypothetical protein A2Z45_02900 [Chloroflexi bacterium RBG_19FT_COMBO_55_16]